MALQAAETDDCVLIAGKVMKPIKKFSILRFLLMTVLSLETCWMQNLWWLMTISEPEEISSWSGGYWTKLPTIPIQGFAIDSRSSCEDALFVALRAERDGHEFLSQAIVSGAIGGLVDHPISEVDCPQLVVQDTQEALQKIAAKYRSNFSGTVIGVTGSCGKTSTKELLKYCSPKLIAPRVI